MLLGDTAGNCAASQHRESVTLLPLCYHSQVMGRGEAGGGGGGGWREGGKRGKMKGCDERERKAHGYYILCSCLHAFRALQKNGHLPTESHLFQEYAGYVVMTT